MLRWKPQVILLSIGWPRITRRPGLNSKAACHLRQQFLRIIQRAGVQPWPKLFHNLRASRETELMREYDLATVCKWIGNSPAVAAKHYAMSVDLNADFSRAAGRVIESKQAQQSAAGRVRQPMTSDWEIPQKPREIEVNDNAGQLPAPGVIEGIWAIQDSNYSRISREILQIDM